MPVSHRTITSVNVFGSTLRNGRSEDKEDFPEGEQWNNLPAGQ